MKSIVINSLPKSGTNLVVKLLYLLGYNEPKGPPNIMSGTILKNDGWKLFARWILRGGYWNLQPLNVGLDASVFVRKSWIKNRVKKTGMGSFLQAHVPYSRQMELEFLEGNMGMIKVLRDPRDVILSWAHYIPRETAHFAYPAFAGKSLERKDTDGDRGIHNTIRNPGRWFCRNP